MTQSRKRISKMNNLKKFNNWETMQLILSIWKSGQVNSNNLGLQLTTETLRLLTSSLPTKISPITHQQLIQELKDKVGNI